MQLPARIRITHTGREIFSDAVSTDEGYVTAPGCQSIERTVIVR